MARIQRRETPTCMVGNVPLGSCHPVVVQSMTNTNTEDAAATAAQVAALARAGSELVRVTVNTERAAAQVPEIRKRVENLGVEVPLVGDFHYNGHLLLARYPECAEALAKIRINPGNVGTGARRDANFLRMIEAAKEHGLPVRIGVNWGSLDQELLTRLMAENAAAKEPRESRAVILTAMVQSALLSAAAAEEAGLPGDRIVLSAKVSGVQDLVDVYRELARRCSYPLHVGLTEAGMGIDGIVASTAGLSVLLQEGIGDTIRVSLTPAPGGDRTEEVAVCRSLLQSLEMRRFGPRVTACPGCGRTTSTLFQEMAQSVAGHIDQRLAAWERVHPGVLELKVAVMGCVVNGPGESKHADIGISLPGNGEDPKAPVFIDGRLFKTLRGTDLTGDFLRILDEYVASRFER